MRQFKRFRFWVSIQVLFFLLGCSEVSKNRETILFDVTIIDGTGSAPIPHQQIVIEDGVIKEVSPTIGSDLRTEANVIDYSGKFVVPGFVDLHVHFPPDTTVQDAVLDRLLEFGVTTVLNPGARFGAGTVLRDRIAKKETGAPKMLTAGMIINGDTNRSDITNWAIQVSTESEIRNEIRKQVEEGVDFIKLYRQLPPDLVKVGITEAKKLGIPVIGHMGLTTWGEAVSYGIDMLVHSGWGTPMDEIVNLTDTTGISDTQWYNAYADAPNGRKFMNLVDILIEDSIVVVPTLSITQASALGKNDSILKQFQVELAPDANIKDWWDEGWEEKHPGYLPDSEEEATMLNTVYFPAVLNILKAYFDRGVKIGVGTDVGNSWMTPGVVFHHELALYQVAGIPPLQIIKMATQNGAEALGISDDVGIIAIGKTADLIVLDEDPSKDIRATRSIRGVFVNGKRFIPN